MSTAVSLFSVVYTGCGCYMHYVHGQDDNVFSANYLKLFFVLLSMELAYFHALFCYCQYNC